MKKLTVAALCAALCLDGLVVAVAEQAPIVMSAAPVTESVSWAMVLLGLGMIGVSDGAKHLGPHHR